jgi:ubiquinone/menaquinone biosynthesis C-methylase UbiE
MPRHRGIDIDEQFDLFVTSLILENWERAYFNLGYKDYWEKRVTTDNPVDDKSATEEEFLHFFNRACSYIKKKSNALLDIGCGYGRFFPIYKEQGLKIYGIDISKEMIDEAIKKYGYITEEIKFCGAEKIDYPDNYFDVAIAWAVFDAVKQDQSIYELLRILKKDGIAILTGKNDSYHDDDSNALIAEKKAREKRHPNYFTNYDSMKVYIQKYGGRITDEFFFERRGDFSRVVYKTEKPEKFYEWGIIIKKITNGLPDFKKSEFYKKFSRTWTKNR